MDDLGYCERHQRAFEFVRIPCSWLFECPQCRQEGRYDTWATASTTMNPADQWLVSDRVSSENTLHGWREPDEDPKVDCPLLVVYRDHKYGEYGVIIQTINSMGIESARHQKDRTLLAWQYLPEWEEE